MSEVGALIIKLQAETAQFREDMGKVKADLNGLKGGASETGSAFDYSMGEAKGSLMLVEESVGVHIPRHLNTLIAQIPGVGQAFALMLPVAGVAAAIMVVVELVEKLNKLKEEAFQAGVAQTELGATIGRVMTNAQDKFLQAGIKADELRGNHLAALHKELKLIDHQTLSDLVAQFGVLSGAADKAFALLKAHWFEEGHGSEGAKHSLEEFKAQYDLLNETGKGKEANTLLDEKIKREERILQLQKQARDNVSESKVGGRVGDYYKFEEATIELKKLGVGYTEKEIQSEQDLVDVLRAQVAYRKDAVATANVNKGTATDKANMAVAKDESSLQKLVAEGTLAHAEAVHKLAKTQAEATLEAQKYNNASTTEDKAEQEKKAIELERQAAITAANDELAAKKSAYDADITAAGVNVQKKKEIEQQYKNAVQANLDAIAQANAEAQKKITVIDAQDAQERRTRTIAEAQAEADGVLAIAIKGAQNKEKADMQAAKEMLALHQMSARDVAALEVKAINAEVAAEVKAYKDRINALDKFSKDYQKKVAEYQAKIKAIEQKGEDDVTQLKHQALLKQQMDIQQAEARMYESIASNVAKSIVENKNLVQSFMQTGQQLLEGMLQNLILMELTHNKEKLINAKKAYGDNYTWASAWGGPVAGAIAGAAGFAAVMAFEKGGKIPGEGAVPIIGHGGETVVTKALTDRVERAEATGRNTSSGPMHVNYAPHYHGQYNEAEHQRRFDRSMKDMARRRGMRLN
jgi:hypothetical protein